MMGQAGSKMRRRVGGYSHWCPGCNEMHPLPDGWEFDGDLESPTFHPSFSHSLVHWSEGKSPEGIGQGEKLAHVCHYILRKGILEFQADCFHDLKGQHVALPVLPEGYRDE